LRHLGDVGRHQQGTSAERLDLARQRGDRLRIVIGPRRQRDVRPGLGQAQRDGTADPLRRAGDDRHLPAQSERGVISRHLSVLDIDGRDDPPCGVTPLSGAW
jgi:hypothetical protein